jgi:hypothetical protein
MIQIFPTDERLVAINPAHVVCIVGDANFNRTTISTVDNRTFLVNMSFFAVADRLNEKQ